MRFLINTTAGVLGIFDVATKWGYPDHDSDFGMTLALWGVPEGPFLFLPVLGPSDPRDAAGFGADIAARSVHLGRHRAEQDRHGARSSGRVTA